MGAFHKNGMLMKEDREVEQTQALDLGLNAMDYSGVGIGHHHRAMLALADQLTTTSLHVLLLRHQCMDVEKILIT
jgi:hypothetical protein